jgi:hypothetical protein
MFALVVDDFAVQYKWWEHAQHLLAALKQDYEAVTVDWDGKLFCGITLEWDYINRTVDLLMPGYIADALAEFQHEAPAQEEHQPHWHNAVKTQKTDPIDETELLSAEGNLWLQRITGKFQYYCRAVDPTMNVALSSLASQLTKGTQQTAQDAVQFLNYCPTHLVRGVTRSNSGQVDCNNDGLHDPPTTSTPTAMTAKNHHHQDDDRKQSADLKIEAAPFCHHQQPQASTPSLTAPPSPPGPIQSIMQLRSSNSR